MNPINGTRSIQFGRRGFIGMAASWFSCSLHAQEAGTLPAPRLDDASRPLKVAPTVLAAGSANIVRVRQVLPHDGLAPGDRLLNSLPDLQVGDRFLASLADPLKVPGQTGVLVGGEVGEIVAPGRFGKNGKVYLKLSQLVRREEDTIVPWTLDTTDFSKHPHLKRALINSLFLGEGAGVGMSIASQFSFTGVNPLFMGIGAGAGLLVGIGLVSLRRGASAKLEPGDTFEVEVGSCRCKVLPRSTEIMLYPANAPATGAKK